MGLGARLLSYVSACAGVFRSNSSGNEEVCNFLTFAVSFELYWPYFAYCCGLLVILGRTMWSMTAGQSSTTTLGSSIVQLLRQTIWRMFLKVVSVWLIGGSLFFAFGAWLCKVT